MGDNIYSMIISSPSRNLQESHKLSSEEKYREVDDTLGCGRLQQSVVPDYKLVGLKPVFTCGNRHFFLFESCEIEGNNYIGNGLRFQPTNPEESVPRQTESQVTADVIDKQISDAAVAVDKYKGKAEKVVSKHNAHHLCDSCIYEQKLSDVTKVPFVFNYCDMQDGDPCTTFLKQDDKMVSCNDEHKIGSYNVTDNVSSVLNLCDGKSTKPCDAVQNPSDKLIDSSCNDETKVKNNHVSDKLSSVSNLNDKPCDDFLKSSDQIFDSLRNNEQKLGNDLVCKNLPSLTRPCDVENATLSEELLQCSAKLVGPSSKSSEKLENYYTNNCNSTVAKTCNFCKPCKEKNANLCTPLLECSNKQISSCKDDKEVDNDHVSKNVSSKSDLYASKNDKPLTYFKEYSDKQVSSSCKDEEADHVSDNVSSKTNISDNQDTQHYKAVTESCDEQMGNVLSESNFSDLKNDKPLTDFQEWPPEQVSSSCKDDDNVEDINVTKTVSAESNFCGAKSTNHFFLECSNKQVGSSCKDNRNLEDVIVTKTVSTESNFSDTEDQKPLDDFMECANKKISCSCKDDDNLENAYVRNNVSSESNTCDTKHVNLYAACAKSSGKHIGSSENNDKKRRNDHISDNKSDVSNSCKFCSFCNEKNAKPCNTFLECSDKEVGSSCDNEESMDNYIISSVISTVVNFCDVKNTMPNILTESSDKQVSPLRNNYVGDNISSMLNSCDIQISKHCNSLPECSAESISASCKDEEKTENDQMSNIIPSESNLFDAKNGKLCNSLKDCSDKQIGSSCQHRQTTEKDNLSDNVMPMSNYSDMKNANPCDIFLGCYDKKIESSCKSDNKINDDRVSDNLSSLSNFSDTIPISLPGDMKHSCQRLFLSCKDDEKPENHHASDNGLSEYNFIPRILQNDKPCNTIMEGFDKQFDSSCKDDERMESNDMNDNVSSASNLCAVKNVEACDAIVESSDSQVISFHEDIEKMENNRAKDSISPKSNFRVVENAKNYNTFMQCSDKQDTSSRKNEQNMGNDHAIDVILTVAKICGFCNFSNINSAKPSHNFMECSDEQIGTSCKYDERVENYNVSNNTSTVSNFSELMIANSCNNLSEGSDKHISSSNKHDKVIINDGVRNVSPTALNLCNINNAKNCGTILEHPDIQIALCKDEEGMEKDLVRDVLFETNVCNVENITPCVCDSFFQCSDKHISYSYNTEEEIGSTHANDTLMVSKHYDETNAKSCEAFLKCSDKQLGTSRKYEEEMGNNDISDKSSSESDLLQVKNHVDFLCNEQQKLGNSNLTKFVLKSGAGMNYKHDSIFQKDIANSFNEEQRPVHNLAAKGVSIFTSCDSEHDIFYVDFQESNNQQTLPDNSAGKLSFSFGCCDKKCSQHNDCNVSLSNHQVDFSQNAKQDFAASNIGQKLKPRKEIFNAPNCGSTPNDKCENLVLQSLNHQENDDKGNPVRVREAVKPLKIASECENTLATDIDKSSYDNMVQLNDSVSKNNLLLSKLRSEVDALQVAEKETRQGRDEMKQALKISNETIALLKHSWETKSAAADERMLNFKTEVNNRLSRNKDELSLSKLKIATLEQKFETMGANQEKIRLQLQRSESDIAKNISTLESKHIKTNAAVNELLLKLQAAEKHVNTQGEALYREMVSAKERIDKFENKMQMLTASISNLSLKLDDVETSTIVSLRAMKAKLDFANESASELEAKYQTLNSIVKDLLMTTVKESEIINNTRLNTLSCSLESVKETVGAVENRFDSLSRTTNVMMTKLERADQNTKALVEELDLANVRITAHERNLKTMNEKFEWKTHDDSVSDRIEQLSTHLGVVENSFGTLEHHWDSKCALLDQMLKKMQDAELSAKTRTECLNVKLKLADDRIAKFDSMKRTMNAMTVKLEKTEENTKTLSQELDLVNVRTATLERNLNTINEKLWKNTGDESVPYRTEQLSKELSLVTKSFEAFEYRWDLKSALMDQMLKNVQDTEQTIKRRGDCLSAELQCSNKRITKLEAKCNAGNATVGVQMNFGNVECNVKIQNNAIQSDEFRSGTNTIAMPQRAKWEVPYNTRSIMGTRKSFQNGECNVDMQRNVARMDDITSPSNMVAVPDRLHYYNAAVKETCAELKDITQEPGTSCVVSTRGQKLDWGKYLEPIKSNTSRMDEFRSSRNLITVPDGPHWHNTAVLDSCPQLTDVGQEPSNSHIIASHRQKLDGDQYLEEESKSIRMDAFRSPSKPITTPDRFCWRNAAAEDTYTQLRDGRPEPDTSYIITSRGQRLERDISSEKQSRWLRPERCGKVGNGEQSFTKLTAAEDLAKVHACQCCTLHDP